MRSSLCLFIVCLFASTAAAQFGPKGAAARNAAPPPDTAQKKTTNEKGHAGIVEFAVAEERPEMATAAVAAADENAQSPLCCLRVFFH